LPEAAKFFEDFFKEYSDGELIFFPPYTILPLLFLRKKRREEFQEDPRPALSFIVYL